MAPCLTFNKRGGKYEIELRAGPFNVDRGFRQTKQRNDNNNKEKPCGFSEGSSARGGRARHALPFVNGLKICLKNKR